MSNQQTLLLNTPTKDREALSWQKACNKECIRFGDHGQLTELLKGQTHCFNCGAVL